MDLDLQQTYSYFLNLLNPSMNSNNFDINQNLFNILVPFYTNILNNPNKQFLQNNSHLIEKELNSLFMNTQKTSDKDLVANNELYNHFNRQNHAINGHNYEANERPINSGLTSDQSIKAQNLHKILNRIQSIKGFNDNSMAGSDGRPTVVSDTSAFYSRPMTNQNHLEPNVDSNISFEEFKQQSMANTKTVRQLLEERQTFMHKLEMDQLELSKINQKIRATRARNSQTLENLQRSARHESPMLEMFPIQMPPLAEIYDNDNERAQVKEVSFSYNKPVGETRVCPVLERQMSTGKTFVANLPEVPELNEIYKRNKLVPKKGLTVRQMLEKHRKRENRNKQQFNTFPYKAKTSRKTSFHAHDCQDFLQHYNRGNESTMETLKATPNQSFLGLSANNPIVLSEDEECDSGSCDSLLLTDKSLGSDNSLSQDLFNLFTDHNYFSNPNIALQAQAKRVINDLNREMSENKSNSCQQTVEDIDQSLSSEQMKSLRNNLERNHSNQSQPDFARHLNLIQARDLKRKPYAYLSSKWPSNGISRSIYAGVETKRAVLDFPRSETFDNKLIETKTNNKSFKRLNARQKGSELRDMKRRSNNWLNVLENLDFSSPLSQKIIRIFPEYQTKRKIVPKTA